MGDEMKGSMLPGRIISCAGAAGFGCTTETGVTAISALTVRRLASWLFRERMPTNKIATTTTRTMAIFSHVRRGRSRCGAFSGAASVLISTSFVTVSLIEIFPYDSQLHSADDFAVSLP